MEYKTLNFVSTSRLTFDERGNDTEVPIERADGEEAAAPLSRLPGDQSALWQQLEEQQQKAVDAREQLGKSLRGLKAVDEDEAAFLARVTEAERRREQEHRAQLAQGLEEREAEQQRQRERQAAEQRRRRQQRDAEDVRAAMAGTLPVRGAEEERDAAKGLFGVGTQITVAKKRAKKKAGAPPSDAASSASLEPEPPAPAPKKPKLSLVDY